MVKPNNKFASQRGNMMLTTAIAVLAGSVITLTTAKNAINSATEATGTVVGNQLQTVVDGLNAYISAKSSGLNSGNVAGVANAYAPTVDELKSLGYLGSWVLSVPAYGGSYVNAVTKKDAACSSNCSFYGTSRLQMPFVTTDKNASVDIRLLQSASNASKTSQIGYSLPGSSSTVTGPGWVLANPDTTSKAGILMATTNVVAKTGQDCSAYDESKGIDCTNDTQLKVNTAGTAITAIGINAGAANTTGSSNVFTGADAGGSNTTGSSNVFTGAGAGGSNTTGYSNVFTGAGAGGSNTTGYSNVFTGVSAGKFNTTGYSNVFTGAGAGGSNTTGYSNVFTGSGAGYYNTTGGVNVFTGDVAGYSNTTGYNNTFTGGGAGKFNTTGQSNVFTGTGTGYSNTTGSSNVFTGSGAGYSNTTGHSNVFTGAGAGGSNTTGYSNIFTGGGAGNYNTTGFGNIFIGIWAGSTNTTSSNVIAIGANAMNTVSNTARIGNTSMTQIGGQVGWSNLSDRRFKENVRTSDRGLSFINKLRPVDYILISNQKAETGFIAQEVEEIDGGFPGINRPANDSDFYSLTYTDFIPSIVKSIQELSAQVDKLNPPSCGAASELPLYILLGGGLILTVWNISLQRSVNKLKKAA